MLSDRGYTLIGDTVNKKLFHVNHLILSIRQALSRCYIPPAIRTASSFFPQKEQRLAFDRLHSRFSPDGNYVELVSDP